MSRHRHSPASERPALCRLAERLREQSRKITGPREAVLNLLSSSGHPMSAMEIFTAMTKKECDLATIYRSLRLLEKMGIVKRFDFGDGTARFELLAEGDDGHHHHLVCVRCSDIVELTECSMSDLEHQIAARNGFKAVTHKLEFFGVCPRCQDGPIPKS
jgi:Fur family ferric uptake transcriptional regulator